MVAKKRLDNILKKSFSSLQILFFLSTACLLSYYFLFLYQIPRYNIQKHSFYMNIGSFLLLVLILFLFLIGVWTLYSRFTAKFFSLEYSKALSQDLLTYLPLFFLLLLPIANSYYLTADDLGFRFKLFGIALLFAFLYLKWVNLYLLSKEKSRSFSTITRKFFSLPTKKKLIILFILSLIVYNVGSAILLSEGITLSGDEPHYLLISQSLLQDGDFNLSNNYANRDYRKYMPPTTDLDHHVAPRTHMRYSFHSPGLSVLLLPFYTLGSFFGGKLQLFIIRFGMSIFGILLGLQIFLYACQEWKNEKLALGLWAIFSFSSPVFFYSLHIYPEIIVALFSLLIYRLLRFSKAFSKFSLLMIGLLLSSFIWLHAVKYTFILVPLFLYCLWELLKKHKIGWNIIYFLIFPLCLMFLHLLFSHSLYGSFSIFSVSLKGATTASESAAYLKRIITEVPFQSRLETLAGYFFDQRDGLLFYAPVYFFIFLGMIEMARHNRKVFITILFLSAPYVLFHAFLTQRTSFAPQARTLVAVFWVMAVFLGNFLAYNAKRIFSYLFYLASFLSLLVVYLLLRNPWALYQSTTAGEVEKAGKLFVLLSNLNLYLPKFLPSYLKIGTPNWPPNSIWLLALILFVGLYLLVKKQYSISKFSKHLVCSFLALFIFFAWIVLFPRIHLLSPLNTTLPSKQKITFYALGQVARMIKPGQFHFPADNREYIFYFTSWRKINKFNLDFGSLEGDYYVEINFFDKELFRGKTSGEIKTLTIPKPLSFPFKKTNLYRVSIYLERKSAVSMLKHPYFFAIVPFSQNE